LVGEGRKWDFDKEEDNRRNRRSSMLENKKIKGG
jgi:hypothetical protein